MSKLTTSMRQAMERVVVENLTNVQRVKVSGIHLELNTDRIRKYQPVCLLTTDVWGQDKLPADFRVVDNRVVAAPDGYDLTKAFYFQGSAYHPVMEAKIDMTKMKSSRSKGLTFKLHKAGSEYISEAYVCVPKERYRTDACLGSYSNDHGGVAVTKEQYDVDVAWNECRVALLMLKGFDKKRDYEPVPIGAVLYAHNIKAGGDITSAWYVNRAREKKKVFTTFGWSPPVCARQAPDFVTAPSVVQKIPEHAEKSQKRPWVDSLMKIARQWEQEREGSHRSLKEKGEEIEKLKREVISHKRKYGRLNQKLIVEHKRARTEDQDKIAKLQEDLAQKDDEIVKAGKKIKLWVTLYKNLNENFDKLLEEKF